MKKKLPHITIRNESLFCTNCGGSFLLHYPMETVAFERKIDQFSDLHKDCLKTWEEPIPYEGMSFMARKIFWLEKGERGASSEAIFNVLSNVHNGDYPLRDHPHDPDDFKRCYNLLQIIPEWRQDLYRMKDVSKTWNRLVDNWDTLTEMYEEVTEGRNNAYAKMYKYMRTLM
jgi:hypothetical protein